MAAVEQPSEKGGKFGIQGGRSQEQFKKEIKEGEKLARQGGSWAVARKKPKGEPRRKTGLGVIRWQRKICDQLAISEIRNSVIEKYRNPFSFQLSGE